MFSRDVEGEHWAEVGEVFLQRLQATKFHKKCHAFLEVKDVIYTCYVSWI